MLTISKLIKFSIEIPNNKYENHLNSIKPNLNEVNTKNKLNILQANMIQELSNCIKIPIANKIIYNRFDE